MAAAAPMRIAKPACMSVAFCEARSPPTAGDTGEQIRARDQSQDGQLARARSAADVARRSRRGDRIGFADEGLWPILLQKSAARCIRSADFFGSVVACGLDDRYKQRRRCGRAANATLTPLTQRTRRSDLEDETTVWRCGAGSGRWLRA